MQGNNGKGNIEERDDWETPTPLFTALNKDYKFTYDCCCSLENSKCEKGAIVFQAVGSKLYNEVCWMNPPFSKAFEMFEHFFKVVEKGVCIYRCDNMETKIWQMILKHADWIHIFPSRINYEGKKGKGARFPSALIGFNVVQPNKQRINGVTLFT